MSFDIVINPSIANGMTRRDIRIRPFRNGSMSRANKSISNLWDIVLQHQNMYCSHKNRRYSDIKICSFSKNFVYI